MAEAWFDLGLIYKWERRWEEALDCNQRAAELVGPRKDEPAWWNLGIAATALRRWEVARSAWKAYGIDLPDAAGQIEGDFGLAPIRLNPDGDAEVVWAQRVDPARARLVSIPFPQSQHRWADVVLHDGAPSGYRVLNGSDRAVFDELERWQPSDVPTVETSVTAEGDGAVDELIAAVEAAGFAAEDWTRNVRVLCRRCSEGVVHAEHEAEVLDAGEVHFLGLAAPLRDVERIVEEWATGDGRACHFIEQAF